MIKFICFIALLFLLPPLSFNQNNIGEKLDLKGINNNRVYFFWGWNRAWYSNSDIHFTGENYNFKLSNVKAKDRQTPFALDPYFNPGMITIPQTNVRLGYFINDKLDISIGYDHMKYVMVNLENTKINGYINVGNKYDRTYINDDINLNYDFLMFEHTDGLNYIDIEITRNDNFLDFFKINHNPNKFRLNTFMGFGGGFLLPRSNVLLMNGERYDEFHLAGYGFSTKLGLDVILLKNLFFRGEFKNGFIDMPSIRTTPNPNDNASQFFFFSQINFSVGYTFHTTNKK